MLRVLLRFYGVFLSELLRCGVVELTTEAADATAGVLFAKRKDGRLKLIFDTRVPNA